MSQPVWITQSGSLGTIPENVFYQSTLLASSAPLSVAPTCTATTTGTDRITCDSTTGLYAGLNIMFTGTVFGGVTTTTRYFVLDVVNSTQFRISATEYDTSPVTLTTASGSMGSVVTQHIYYFILAGALPPGIQVSDNGLIVGVPQAVASLQGVPFDVNRDVTSKFTIRAYTQNYVNGAYVLDRIRDRTFSLTVTGNQVPVFTTPAGSIGSYYDGDLVDYQIEYTNVDPNETLVISLVSGALPGGVTISSAGLINGYIKPVINVDAVPGYDDTSSYVQPYDFLVSSVNKNYQFTLKITDGKTSSLRTFYFYVYSRNSITADTTAITADNTFVTADETTERRPFITNSLPSNLGTVRGDNYYAYQFVGNDYDTTDLTYAISVNQGSGLAPGLTLDPVTGWYYGYIPDQGVTEVEYSFNIVVYQSDYVGTPIACTATAFATNIITCDSTSQILPGQPIVFTGTGFGGVTASATQVYYVLSVDSATTFTITENFTSTTPVAVSLTTDSGTISANLIVASDLYPFTIIVSGAINAEVVWNTPADLGNIENGDTSLLKIQATNVGGRTLLYRLKNGAYNKLPQGLELLPSGEISGRVTFNTFAIDLGSTTFDSNATTWDTEFTFTVNAYAEDSQQILYNVRSVTVDNGGTGYSTVTPPVLTFNTPIGASAVAAQTGTITIVAGAITAVALDNVGAGYTSPATLTVIEGYGGSNATFTPVMRATGIRDVVSVYKTFTVKVIRAYNKPYQNLTVQAMPPANDRVLIASLLGDEEIFVPDYIFRSDDPYYGKSTKVTYQHAFGLAPDMLIDYVNSLYENHYWKNLVLGEIGTAQALDPVTGEIIYEVVYSQIIDDLVNASGASVNKIVNLPYPIDNPTPPPATLTQVYPNSLVNMLDQVIDTVGQISTKLPLWMTSKQTDGRVLGFTPAWVICYANPGRGRQISYYIQSQFAGFLNAVDFKVDRYILNTTLSRNWDTVTQSWTPTPSLTTFDLVLHYEVRGENADSSLSYHEIATIPAGTGGTGYVSGNQILVLGSDVGGQDGVNDITITVTDVDAGGAITIVAVSGTAPVFSLDDTYVGIAGTNITGSGVGATFGFKVASGTATTFDYGSIQFEAPVDMYDPSDRYDKYLVFPKANILV